MAKINVLEKHLAELIAAGEVVERPASAAKELVENAVDAGATEITVEIQNGGITYLRVTDNGSGISRSDVPLAFLRHATSKIASVSDLSAIGTLGFRGEALASICAMARVELLTRTADELAGTRYRIEGGDEISCEDAGCPVGTTLVVRDLFYNTPARMKFLKKDVSEANAVAGVVDKAALSHPEISFRFLRDGKETLRTSGDGKLRSAIFAVYGKDFLQGMLPVSYSLGNIRVEGFVSRPSDARPTRAMQNFFINGRFVKSRTAGAAVDEAAKGSVMVGKYLSCVLHLTIPVSSVDVNVHPAKIEVRFTTERPIFDAVYHGIKSALAQGDTVPSPLQFAEKGRPGTAASGNGRSIGLPSLRVSDSVSAASPARQPIPSQNTVVFPKPPVSAAVPPKQDTAFSGSAATGTGKFITEQLKRTSEISEDDQYIIEVPSIRSFGSPLPQFAAGKVSEPMGIETKSEPTASSEFSTEPKQTVEKKPAVPKPTDTVPNPLAGFSPLSSETAEKESPLSAESQVLSAANAPTLRLIGELFHTYILLEARDEMILIDKHAAHERLIYEQLKARQGQPEAQQLLVPVTVTPDKETYSLLLEHRDLLDEAGFTLEEFGGNTLLVRSAPLSLDPGDITDALFEIASHLAENRRDLSTSQQDWLLHNIACRAAMKGGDTRSPEELTALAQQLYEHPEVRYCPHGRPVYLSMKKREIEKQFGRTN